MIHVDKIVDYTGMTKLKYKLWCHMWTDGPIEELHEFAKSLGLLQRWFQDKAHFPHYDITPGKRKLALLKGAQISSYMEYYKRKGCSKNRQV